MPATAPTTSPTNYTTPAYSTTQLPDMHPYRSGDTDEIPAVAGPRADRGWARTIGLATLMLVLVAVAAAVAFLPTSLITGADDDATTIEQVDESTALDESRSDAGTAGPENAETATISPLDDELPQSWSVTGATDGLNVRAEPGVDGELIGTLRADATLIRGTGRRVAVDDREWKQIRFQETVGWVSAAYLVAAADPGDAGAEPIIPVSFECYEGRVAGTPMVLLAEFVAGGSSFVGAMRFDSVDDGVAISPFRGSRTAPGTFDVELTGAEESTWTEAWTFDVDGIVSSSGWRAEAVGCTSMGTRLDELLAARPIG